MTNLEFDCFVELVSNRVITANYVMLYEFYERHQGVSVREIQEALQLSSTAIRYQTETLSQLGLLEKTRVPGRSNRVAVRPPTQKSVKAILANEKLLGDIGVFKDTRINRYHLKSIDASSISNIDINTTSNGDEEGDINSRIKEKRSLQPTKLSALMKVIPKAYRSYRITPKHTRLLERLERKHKIDVLDYAHWFVKKKLGKSVTSFNMGIFLYPGIVSEYLAIVRKREASAKYKNVTSRNKEYFDKDAERFESEFFD